MVKAATNVIARRASNLTQAATSFRELLKSDDLGQKAEQIRTASRTVSALLSAGAFDRVIDEDDASPELRAALHEIKQAFEELSASYDPPSRQEWRDFIAWNNLRTLYSALGL